MIGENHLEVDVSTYKIMDRTIDIITEEDHKKVIEMTLGEANYMEMQNYSDQTIEMDSFETITVDSYRVN